MKCHRIRIFCRYCFIFSWPFFWLRLCFRLTSPVRLFFCNDLVACGLFDSVLINHFWSWGPKKKNLENLEVHRSWHAFPPTEIWNLWMEDLIYKYFTTKSNFNPRKLDYYPSVMRLSYFFLNRLYQVC